MTVSRSGDFQVTNATPGLPYWVQETFTIDASRPQDPPDLGDDPERRFVDAIIPLDGRMMSRLVVDRLMPMAETARKAA